jgi:hypothetical protein
MATGAISYSKVRALTRVATPQNEESLVRLARQGTAAHIEEIVRRYRKVSRVEEAAAAAKAHRSREVRYRWDDDGTLILNARLPAEQGALVLQALAAATEALWLAECAATKEQPAAESSAEDSTAVPAADSSAEDSKPRTRATPYATDQSFAARRADALVLMAETVLQHGAAELPAAERHQVVLHVDASALAGATQDARCELEHGPAIAVESARRMLCDASIVALHEDSDGNPLNVGRKTRAIPTALRRALQSRDRGCRFPACAHKHVTDAHHIHHWVNGGETKLDNLVLLCRVHHRLVHEEGFCVEHTATGLAFRAPDGRRVEDVPIQRVLLHDPVLALMRAHATRAITARTCVPEWMGETPAYDWITDALWRKDHRSVTAADIDNARQ